MTYPAHEAVRCLGTVAPHVKPLIASDADHHLAICRLGWVSGNVLGFLAD